jgi:DNA replication and repair protein RecF
MLLERLSLARFRGFNAVELRPAPGVNLITGSNGAGKTTLLEAAHLLANGRSFRGRVRDGLVRQGQSDLEVFAEWRESGQRFRRAGLRHSGRDWEARLDSQPVASLAELCMALTVLSFEPGSHDLIAGGSGLRRQFLDSALFHVEPEFLSVWRRYGRALKQRNALLKGRPRADLLAPWDRELEDAGEPMTRMRELYLDQFKPLLTQIAHLYLPELGELRFEFLAGWRRDTQSLGEALAQMRDRDLVLGHSGTGPHRADWRIDFEYLPSSKALSRGQEKLVALSCVLAQARAYAAMRGEWPIIALDDLASELDHEHQQRVLLDLSSNGAQILVTGTEPPPGLTLAGLSPTLFHVEQGKVYRLLQ